MDFEHEFLVRENAKTLIIRIPCRIICFGLFVHFIIVAFYRKKIDISFLYSTTINVWGATWFQGENVRKEKGKIEVEIDDRESD